MEAWFGRVIWSFLVFGTLLVGICGLRADACTDFRLRAADGSLVVGRTMEWGVDLKSQITKHPRGENVQSNSPSGKPGLKWTSKYGYLGVNSYGVNLSLDGMNEKGFTAGLLWLPGSTYQKIGVGEEAMAVSLLDLGSWFLGNFATVEEAKGALKDIKVWAPSLADWGGVPTAHVALHDATGKSAVIEFTDGEVRIFDNPIGVLTNAPTFDWHITNLRNYINLSPFADKAKSLASIALEPTGQGTGLIGMPGDLTPPSRFVHTTAYVSFAKPVADSKAAVILAQHIVNSVDIPLGVLRTADGDAAHCDYTQWALIKDLTNRAFHYRAYADISLHTIKLDQMDFSAGSKTKSCPVSGETFFCDVSNYLK